MDLTDLDRRLLVGIARDTQRLRAAPPGPGDGFGSWHQRLAAARRRTASREAADVGVRVDLLGWAGRNDDAGRQAVRRALAKLEAAGLLTRHGYDSGPLTHAKLTPLGEALVQPPPTMSAGERR